MMQKVIWLIDNEILYLQLIERYLHGFGHKVQTFLSSKICLQNIKKIAVEDRPDILIIDCQMPELDGYQLCENIQQISAPEVPFIVMMSSKEPQYEKIKVLASGADYFLPKPIEKENLLQIVQG